MARSVGAVLCLAQQRLPFRARQAALVEIRPCPLSAVIEEAHVVIGILQRQDLLLDETVKLVEVGNQFDRQREIHNDFSRSSDVLQPPACAGRMRSWAGRRQVWPWSSPKGDL